MGGGLLRERRELLAPGVERAVRHFGWGVLGKISPNREAFVGWMWGLGRG